MYPLPFIQSTYPLVLLFFQDHETTFATFVTFASRGRTFGHGLLRYCGLEMPSEYIYREKLEYSAKGPEPGQNEIVRSTPPNPPAHSLNRYCSPLHLESPMRSTKR